MTFAEAFAATLNDPILGAIALPTPELFSRLALLALVLAAVMVPVIVATERRA